MQYFPYYKTLQNKLHPIHNYTISNLQQYATLTVKMKREHSGYGALMKSKPHLQLQSYPYASPEHTQQGYDVWSCNRVSSWLSLSLQDLYSIRNPLSSINTNVKANTRICVWNTVIWEKLSVKTEVGRGCCSLTGGGMGRLSALSALSCCSLNDKKRGLSVMLCHQVWLCSSSHPTILSPGATDCFI